ncbi:hypothetical protein B0H14DRAFT_3612016 [Mycena olivaceomarginata]|nr:hypothetical protein B0H14DRAFT_3612016 [Mycena olivaceomarginata]
MAPKSNPEPKPVTGPPRELIARIEHLRTLLRNLPTSLPENPPDSRYRFYLESDALEDLGYIGELSHALEVSFDGSGDYNGPESSAALPATVNTTSQMEKEGRELHRTIYEEEVVFRD